MELGLMHSKKILLAILVAALGVRLVYFYQFSETPFYRVPMLDARYYDDLARHIAAGKLVGSEAFFMGPLYPYVLGALYALFGSALWVPRLFQIFLGVLDCFLVFLVGRRVFSETVALLAAAMFALYKPAIFYEQTLLMETLLTTLVLLALLVALVLESRTKPYGWLLAGFLFGLAALTRANVLLFVPFFAAWLIARQKLSEEDDAARRRLMLAVALLILGIAVAILPATLHNYLAEKDFVLITSNGAFNFYIGNNEAAKGTFVLPEDVDMERDPRGARIAERALWRSPLKSSEISAYWSRRAREFIRAKPATFLSLLVRKFYYFWGRTELPQIYNIHLMRSLTPLLSYPLLSYGVLSPLALLGIVLVLIKPTRKSVLLVLFLLAYVLSVIPFFITARYRIAVTPLMGLFAASAIVSVVALIRGRRYPRAAACVASVVVLFFVLDNSGARNLAAESSQFHNQLGLIYKKEGDFKKAEQEFLLSLGAQTAAHNASNLATLYYEDLHDLDRAIHYYEKALLFDRGNAQILFNLAQATLKKGLKERSRACFEEALKADPKINPLANFNLALLYREKGDLPRAIHEMQNYRTVASDDIQAGLLLAEWQLSAADMASAQKTLERLRRVAPREPRVYYYLGIVYQKQGNLEEARKAWERALEMRPDFAEARKALEELR
jgi:4-amino-4-deoxy-L-arabinose transferase-like glycosyltransferase/Flp pilus assembly protein TadD